jgi:predicted ATPase
VPLSSTNSTFTTRDNFFVLTGASGSGKSSIIAALEHRGYRCVEEMGRQVVRDEVRAGSNGTPWQDSERFMALVFARYVEAFVTMPERRAPVFFDRGIPEGLGAALAAGRPPDPDRLHAATTMRYNRTVFVTPPWPDIYVTDAERRHTFDEGVAHHRAEIAAYIACGYALLEVPRAPVADRVAFILQDVSRLDPS